MIDLGDVRSRLVAWYRDARRDLPWRRTRDPYRVWVSEAMLQQTRVETVIPYYERFLERFPTADALALADEQDVLREWAGLGYYSRARNLHRAAQIVVRDHAGELPREPGALERLPGIGRYTAGAIRSIAFREPAPIVDGNVARVLSRLHGWREATAAASWSAAAAIAAGPRPDLANQALMELGALVCTPRSPRCADCPAAHACSARASGQPERFPAPRARPAPRAVRAVAGLLERTRPARQVLLVRRPSRGLLGGLWALPSVEGDSTAALEREVRALTGIAVRARERLGLVRHEFSHRSLALGVVRLDRASGRLRPGPDARWCQLAEPFDVPLSALARKMLRFAYTGR